MGYFSNGTEGTMYFERYCRRCLFWNDDHGCPCWNIHLQYNYEECNKDDSILHKMIPRHGVFNGRCFSFFPRKGESDPDKDSAIAAINHARRDGSVPPSARAGPEPN